MDNPVSIIDAHVYLYDYKVNQHSRCQKQLGILNQYKFKCGLEVFGHQLLDLIEITRFYPNIEFTIALSGLAVRHQ
jgi:hypothetical protein